MRRCSWRRLRICSKGTKIMWRGSRHPPECSGGISDKRKLDEALESQAASAAAAAGKPAPAETPESKRLKLESSLPPHIHSGTSCEALLQSRCRWTSEFDSHMKVVKAREEATRQKQEEKRQREQQDMMRAYLAMQQAQVQAVQAQQANPIAAAMAFSGMQSPQSSPVGNYGTGQFPQHLQTPTGGGGGQQMYPNYASQQQQSQNRSNAPQQQQQQHWRFVATADAPDAAAADEPPTIHFHRATTVLISNRVRTASLYVPTVSKPPFAHRYNVVRLECVSALPPCCS